MLMYGSAPNRIHSHMALQNESIRHVKASVWPYLIRMVVHNAWGGGASTARSVACAWATNGDACFGRLVGCNAACFRSSSSATRNAWFAKARFCTRSVSRESPGGMLIKRYRVVYLFVVDLVFNEIINSETSSFQYSNSLVSVNRLTRAYVYWSSPLRIRVTPS
jgi:hypothetical protein